MQVRPTITESYFNDTDDHESSEFLEPETEEFAQTVNAKIKQIPRPTSLRANIDEVDLVPSRGPSASSTLIESDSSSLHASVCRYCDQTFHNCGNFENFNPKFLLIKIQ